MTLVYGIAGTIEGAITRTMPNWESSEGATLVESALLMLLVVVFAMSAVAFFGAQVSGLTDQVSDAADGTVSATTAATTSTVPAGGGSDNAGPNSGGVGNGGKIGIPFVCEDFDPSDGSTPPEVCGVGHGG
ncbi:MAG: hypothetical protein JJE47_08175 [Acidimicrobiia bacterium]|nr:hypothetical protein [Acidimicrobiia bacterium]